jgi:hypothetical protein
MSGSSPNNKKVLSIRFIGVLSLSLSPYSLFTRVHIKGEYKEIDATDFWMLFKNNKKKETKGKKVVKKKKKKKAIGTHRNTQSIRC